LNAQKRYRKSFDASKKKTAKVQEQGLQQNLFETENHVLKTMASGLDRQRSRDESQIKEWRARLMATHGAFNA